MDTNTLSVKHLIIGGGISGLTLAYYLKDQDYLILEKDSEVGGYCRTIKHPDYVWDYAGHFYHFKTEEMKQLFLSLVEPEEIITQKKVTKIYYGDKLIDYPFQMNIHQLDQQDFIDCLYDLFFKTEKETYDNFLDMLYGKFGKGIVERFLKPYNEKLYAIDLTKLDTNAMGRFFPYADLEGIVRNFKVASNSSYNDTFLYLKKGTQYFIDKLYGQIDTSKVRFNTAISSIDTVNKVATTTDGQLIHYENLINTIPLNKFFGLLDNDYSETVDSMSYNKVLVFNLGFDKQSPNYKDEHWVYYPDKSLNFYRIGFYNNILNQDKLSVYVEIGYSKDAVISDDEAEKQLSLTLEGMKKVGIIDDTISLVDKSVIVMDPAYVHISEKTDALLDKTKEELLDKQIHTTGRYGKWTYCSMEDCMVWAKEIADSIS